MKRMPEKIKLKLREAQKAHEKARDLDCEVAELISKYGIDIECLNALNTDDVYTEALAFITNAEGNIEDNIAEIEEVFLYYVNNQHKKE